MAAEPTMATGPSATDQPQSTFCIHLSADRRAGSAVNQTSGKIRKIWTQMFRIFMGLEKVQTVFWHPELHGSRQ